MKRTIISFLCSVFVATSIAADATPVSLPAALASRGRTGYAPLSEGYRGELRVIARTGVAATLDSGNDPETLEFTDLNYDNRWIGARCKPAFAIMVGSPASYRFPAIHIKDIPSIERLKQFKRIEDFEKIFGEFRSITDGWGGDGGMHSSLGWTGFALQPDGSIRVVSVFLHTLHRAKTASIEGANIREGLFKPTGKTPQLEKR